MGHADGSPPPQDPRRLPRLPRKRPRRTSHTATTMSTGEPDATEIVRRLTRRWIAPSGGRGSGGGDLGAARLTWTGNREGTTAWRGSAERSGDAEGVAVQGPRDMAKARLLESQSPVVETSHLPTRRLRSGPPASDGSDFRHPNLPAGGRRAASPFKGTDRDAYVTLDTSGAQRNSGWPTGREPYGHGGSVVVAGVTPCQGGRESRLHGRRDPGAQIGKDGEVREMRDAATVLEIISERGRRGLPLERVYRCLFNPDLYLLAYGKISCRAVWHPRPGRKPWERPENCGS